MFDVLLSGKLRSAPELRQSRNGSMFATFRLNVPTSKDGGYMQASCITFSESAIEALASLVEGDALAVNGEAAIKTWDGKHGVQAGLDVTVANVLTAYAIKKKRGAAKDPAPDAPPQQAGHPFDGDSPTTGGRTKALPKFQHPDFRPHEDREPPEGWDNLDGV